MKQKLLTLFVLAAMTIVGAGGAKADTVVKIGETGYESFEDAIIAAADGATLEIQQSLTIGASSQANGRFLLEKSLTIKPKAGESVTLTRNSNKNIANTGLFALNADNIVLTFDGTDGTLIYDANNIEGTSFETVTNKKNCSFVFKNMTIKNNQGNQGALYVRQGAATLENVTFDNCKTGVRNLNSVVLKGNITFNANCSSDNLQLGNAGSFDATELTSPSTAYTMTLVNEPTTSKDYVLGSSSDNFDLIAKDYMFVANGDNWKILECQASIANTRYQTLATAVAALTDGDVIVLERNFVLGDRIDITNPTENDNTPVSFTIKQREGKDIIITRSGSNNTKGWLNIKEGNVTVTIDGSGTGSLTFDGENTDRSGTVPVLALGFFSGKPSVLNVNDVTIKNVTKSSGSYGLISARSNVAINLSNIIIENCSDNDGICYTSGNGTLKLTGDITVNNCDCPLIVLDKKSSSGSRINADGLNKPNIPLTIKYLDGETNMTPTGTLSVNNSTHPEYFRLISDYTGWELRAYNGSLYAYKVTDSYPLTVTAAGMSTLVLPFNAALPSGVTAYTLATADGKVKATSVSSITKDEPVLIKAAAGTYNFTSTSGDADYNNTNPTSGALVGTYYAIDAADGNYVLQYGASGVGFYKLGASSNHVIKPFRAYLSGDENVTAAHLSIVFDEGETTGIKSMDNGQLTMDNAFDLQGRRVAQPTKGLYIVNGKKVVIK